MEEAESPFVKKVKTMKERHYPRVVIDLGKLRNNIEQILGRCRSCGVDVAGVVKCVDGNLEVARAFEECGAKFIASSRLAHLERLKKGEVKEGTGDGKSSGIKIPLMLIRVPMISEAERTVAFSDISLNSEISVLKALDAAAIRAGKKHGVILMDDLGDLREGFWDIDDLVSAALMVEQAQGLELMGIGTNVGCYGSVMATPEKLQELVDDAEIVEEKIGRKLAYISGGATSSIPRILEGNLPERINMLRIGEGIIVARDLIELYGYEMDFMCTDVSVLEAEVIEVKTKASHPVGEIGYDAFGNKMVYEDRGMRKRALIGIGKIDFAFGGLEPRDEGVEILGGSSDHTILDIENAVRDIKVGDIVKIDIDYGALVFLAQSENVHVVCRAGT